MRFEDGRRWLKFDGFGDNDGNRVQFFAPGTPAAEVDFGGYYWAIQLIGEF